MRKKVIILETPDLSGSSDPEASPLCLVEGIGAYVCSPPPSICSPSIIWECTAYACSLF